MPDFTSALVLGRRHGSADLPAWAALTSGRPAAFGEPAAATALAARWARRTGAAAGVLHRSTLHALWDAAQMTAEHRAAVVVDAGAYAVSEVAAAGALSRGRSVGRFRHHDAEHLARLADELHPPLVVLTDGFCAGCGRPAPLAALTALVAQRGGLVLVDDTLAVGVLGAGRSRTRPLGSGGAGTAAWLGLPASPHRLLVASLAKAYGAPLAVSCGAGDVVAGLARAGTRWHCSPPTGADLTAALVATADEVDNDRRRRHVEALVRRLRDGLHGLGWPVVGLPFPLVSVATGGRRAGLAALAALRRAGVRALLRDPRCRPGPDLSFVVRADHTERDVDRALDVLVRPPEAVAA